MTARVLHGDCLDVMPTLALSSVDAIVTDPPYGLGFMGKHWDHGVPGAHFWAAAQRVAKPGAYLLAFGGTRTYHRLTCAIEDAGWEIHDTISWLYGSGFPKHASKLKPAWEPIVLARRPSERATPLNIDACRINPGEHVRDGGGLKGGADSRHEGWQRTSHSDANASAPHDKGRWPANVVLDEEAAAHLDEQSGILTSGNNPAVRHAPKTRDVYGLGFGDQCLVHRGTDSGGASRFYYCAKASRSERDAGLTGERKPLLWSSGTQSPGTFQRTGTDKSARNNHPTVKPLALMRWLCRLVTPANGLILDPFCGSGSTGLAALAEGFRFIGIEREAAYVEIATARCTQPIEASA